MKNAFPINLPTRHSGFGQAENFLACSSLTKNHQFMSFWEKLSLGLGLSCNFILGRGSK